MSCVYCIEVELIIQADGWMGYGRGEVGREQ